MSCPQDRRLVGIPTRTIPRSCDGGTATNGRGRPCRALLLEPAPPEQSTATHSVVPPAVQPIAAPVVTAAEPVASSLGRTLLEKPRVGFLGGKKHLEEENDQLRAACGDRGGGGEQIAADIARLRADHAVVLASLRAEQAAAQSELASLRAQIVPVAEEAILQEVGIYRYSHPLDSAVAFKERLLTIQGQVKEMAKSDRAVVGITNWTVNGSPREGSKMVKDFSKLMLRAYNNEADNAVRSMKPHLVNAAVERLVKARSTISKLGKTMQIEITDEYHLVRVQELLLTADYMAKLAQEKEREREEKARLREEEVARREYERERQRLQKEEAHYQAALVAMRANGDLGAAADAELKLKEIQAAIEGVDYRVANVRAGYVYVISNVGSFGPRMVKIGMTRSPPLVGIWGLGGLCFPFPSTVHFFSTTGGGG